MKIEVKAYDQLTDFEKARTDCVVTSSLYAYHTGMKWAQGDWIVMVWEDNDLVSNVHIIDRMAKVGEKPVRLGGIGNIATKVEWRKRGYAAFALKTAQKYLADPLRVDFGLMTCIDSLVPHYEKLGWQRVASSYIHEQEGKRMAFTYPVMILPVEKKEFPKGTIDVCGLPW